MGSTNYKGLPLLGLLILTALLTSSCKSEFEHQEPCPPPIYSQEQAGSGHIAVLSVMPWNAHIRAALQPRFSLTADQAVSQVVPTALVEEERLLDMLKVVARVSPPQTGTSTTDVTSFDSRNDPASYTTSETTKTKEPGEAPEFTPSLPGSRAAKDLPGKKDILETPLGMDPMLKHSLATAYYQEVQLLNRYIQYAATRDGYRPYVVRMQVGLMPRARNAPYDAYTTISMFPRGPGGGSSPHVTPKFAQTKGSRYAVDDGEGVAAPTGTGGSINPIIIPLLVTDSMEAAYSSRTTNIVRQYALALSALISGWSLNMEAEKYTDELIATVGNDYNSLYTVARLTDNTIRVRMGAMLQASARYAMVPQTRTVTVLVLAPDDGTRRGYLDVAARTEFVDARTGSVLAHRNEAQLDFAIGQAFTSFAPLARIRGRTRRRELLSHVSANNYEAFTAALVGCLGGQAALKHRQQAWTILTSVHVGSQYASTRFMLPDPKPPTLPTALSAVKVVAIDDGKSSLRVVVRGGSDIQGDELVAELRIGDSANPVYRLPANSASFQAATRALSFVFPSLSRVAVGEDVLADVVTKKKREVWLHVTDATGTGPVQNYPLQVTTLRASPISAKPGVAIDSLHAIKAADFKASVVVELALPEVAKTERTLSLKLLFSKSGGKPAPGRLTKVTVTAGGSVVGAPGLHGVKLKVAKGKKVLRLTLEVEELEDQSLLQLTAKVGKAAAGTRKIVIFAPAKVAARK